MKSIFGTPITANIPARLQLLPILQALVEHGCDLFGINRPQALKLAMSGEELFVHVCSVQPQGLIRIILTPRATGATLNLRFSRTDIDLGGMNLSGPSTLSMDENSKNFDNLGLLLASRMVDGFSLAQEGDIVSVTLRQDSEYPKGNAPDILPVQAQGNVHITTTNDSATVIDDCQRTQAFYAPRFIPDSFDTPGKIADLVMFDELFVVRAVDKTGQTCGTIYWQTLSDKCVGFYGPYIFVDPSEETARILMEKMISSVARTSAKIILSILATEDLPGGFMEPLAQVTYQGPAETTTPVNLWYRHLGEDEGSFVWAHPDLIPFLKKAYEKLELWRDIHPVSSLGEKRHTSSVLSVDLEKNLSKAVLIPMIDGLDIGDNIHTHVESLRQEGIQNIFFHLEMALAWQAHIAKTLLQKGFEPVYILPQAGSSDILVFQHDISVA